MPNTLPLAEQLAACTADADALLGGLTEVQGRWRPGPDQWSIAECVAHLAAIARQYQPGLDTAVAAVRARGRPAHGGFQPGWLGRRFVAAMEPTTGSRRLRTTAALTPPRTVTLAEAEREFGTAQAALRSVLETTAGLDLGSATVRSPILPLLRFSLGTALAGLVAHERRHLAQARRVTQAPGFPTA